MNTITDEGRLMPRRAVLVLAVLLALGLALRVAAIVPYAMGPNTYSDDNGYLTSGITFARTGYIAYADPGLQTTAIGPGMPLLLGGLIALLGADPAGLVAAHIVFSCIGLLTAIAAYLLGELLCSRTAGLIAAGLCVLEPALLSVNIVFLTETPYMCLNLFAIYFLVASVREWRWGRYWAGVLCMCGAAFFKGLGLLALVAPAALLLRRRENLRPWLLRACAALAAFVLLFIPWWVRNGLLTGEFVPFTANRGDIQLMGSYIGFGYPEGTYEEAVLQSDREAWEQGYQDDMERRFARRGEMGKERLWQWFTENPLAFVASHLLYKPLALTVSHLRTVDLMPDRLMALVWWGCLALAAWGLLCPRLGGVCAAWVLCAGGLSACGHADHGHLCAPAALRRVACAHLARVQRRGPSGPGRTRAAPASRKRRNPLMVSPPPVQTTGEVGIHEHEALAALAQGCALRQPPGQRGPRPDGGAYGKCRGDRCRESQSGRAADRPMDRFHGAAASGGLRALCGRPQAPVLDQLLQRRSARGGHGGGLYHSGRHSGDYPAGSGAPQPAADRGYAGADRQRGAETTGIRGT